MKYEEEIRILKKRIKSLEEENRILLEKLSKAGIGHNNKVKSNQTSVNENLARKFFSMFWGRVDVYSKRVVNKSTGEAGYFPQCENFWSDVCYKKRKIKVQCKDCEYKKWKTLGSKEIIKHLTSNNKSGTDVIGVYPMFPDNTCRFLVFDFDNHVKSAEKNDYADDNETWKEEVLALYTICKENNIDALIEKSRSGRGAHVWIFFKKQIKAALARKFGDTLLNKGASFVNLTSFDYYDRMIPAQDFLKKEGLGNLIALPLQGDVVNDGRSVFVDENWEPYENQFEILFSKTKYTEEFIKEFCIDKNENQFKPWEIDNKFNNDDAKTEIKITLSDSIYINKNDMEPRLQNQIRRMAAFPNPTFYKNQAIGLSNFDNLRYIYLAEDVQNYIKLPIGLKDKLLSKLEESNIKFQLEDLRNNGKFIDIKFKGELYSSQKIAVENLMNYDNGILQAATAFGKTVVCTNIIAEHKRSTLILLESSSLIEQWREAIETFLDINEELPSYKTKSGMTRRRKSIIGKIQGSHDSSTGIIDIAMVGSLRKKGEFHHRLKEYGLVIVDECHHAASKTFREILEYINPKYIYGVTATPKREDGLEKTNEMLIGPIRYKFTAKDKAKEQSINRIVVPRFTKTVLLNDEKVSIGEAYNATRNSESRNELIVNDVKILMDEGRNPVVLTKFKDQAKEIYDRLEREVKNIYYLSGDIPKKEQTEIISEIKKISDKDNLAIIATGQLIGEGFDLPRLDTLMLASPIAGESLLEQYTGRLNRDYKTKEEIVVYDYVDWRIPVFNKMYNKRLRTYKKIGFMLNDDSKNNLQSDYSCNAIYDYESYEAVYEMDVCEAKNEVIISSPTLSHEKIGWLIELASKKQVNGVKFKIVTMHPDEYKYGDSLKWELLHEEIKASGIEIILSQNEDKKFTVIDNNIVWYGSLNFLGKSGVEDNLMRVISKSIAEEVIGLACK